VSTTIPQAFVIKWDDAIRLAAQQTESRFMKAVTNRGDIIGESFTINNLSAVDFAENTVRHGDTEWSEITHSTRLGVMRDFYTALPLDRNDIPKMIVNPVTGGSYMQSIMAAKNRKIDQIIYNALRGDIGSKDGATTYSLPVGQKIAHGGTGFTKAKLIQARGLLRKNEADEETGEELFVTYNNESLMDILSDVTLTSADFMATQFLQEGKPGTKWMGFTWIPYEFPIISAVYYALAWAKSSIHFGTGYQEGKVSPRPDKKDATQVSMGASYGAGRQDELKVVEVAFQ